MDPRNRHCHLANFYELFCGLQLVPNLALKMAVSGYRGIFIFGGGNKRLRNVTKMYCQCQISHKRRKKECLGKFKFSLNRLKKQILRKPIFVSASKGKVILI
jgi:hypothetical protein